MGVDDGVSGIPVLSRTDINIVEILDERREIALETVWNQPIESHELNRTIRLAAGAR